MGALSWLTGFRERHREREVEAAATSAFATPAERRALNPDIESTTADAEAARLAGGESIEAAERLGDFPDERTGR